MSLLDFAWNIIIDHVIGAPGHGQDIVDKLNGTDKRPISMLVANVQLNGFKGYYENI